MAKSATSKQTGGGQAPRQTTAPKGDAAEPKADAPKDDASAPPTSPPEETAGPSEPDAGPPQDGATDVPPEQPPANTAPTAPPPDEELPPLVTDTTVVALEQPEGMTDAAFTAIVSRGRERGLANDAIQVLVETEHERLVDEEAQRVKQHGRIARNVSPDMRFMRVGRNGDGSFRSGRVFPGEVFRFYGEPDDPRVKKGAIEILTDEQVKRLRESGASTKEQVAAVLGHVKSADDDAMDIPHAGPGKKITDLPY